MSFSDYSRFLFNLATLSKEESKEFERSLSERNVRFLYILAPIIVFLNSIHIVLFYYGLEGSSPIEYKWRLGIIVCHSLSLLFFSSLFLTLFLLKDKVDNRTNIDLFISILSFMMGISFGIGLSSLDQLITPAISPFLFICVTSPIIIVLRPIYSILIFLVSYTIMHFLMTSFQTNEAILLSNRVNALSFVGIGAFSSFLMWNTNLKRFQQEKLIKKQKIDLEKSYSSLLETSETIKLANSTKDKFFSIIAHDLRSPFNSILGFADLIKTDLSEGRSENLSQYIEFIELSAKKTIQLLENLLLWASSQTGKLQFSPSTFDIAKVIQNVVQLVYGSAEKKDISIQIVNLHTLYVHLDEAMIQTILRNLVSNSIKYTKVKGQVKIEMQSDGQDLVLKISDNGIGIRPSIRESLFRIDRSISTEGTNGESGTGLGLILVKEFLHLHKAKWEIQSEVDKGTQFLLNFPQCVRDQVTEKD
ncbi:sensor histidine kinase [Leptospira ryugenii]|nr:HAMP domain-containing sensor histidine kinase [Leptospira ryugenii]